MPRQGALAFLKKLTPLLNRKHRDELTNQTAMNKGNVLATDAAKRWIELALIAKNIDEPIIELDPFFTADSKINTIHIEDKWFKTRKNRPCPKPPPF